MKAWRLTRYGNFEKGIKLLDQPVPKPTENQVLIECHAASLNPVDYKFAEGQLKMFYKQKMPAGLSFDCSGIVKEVGKNVSHLKVGDEVFCCAPTSSPGSLAEYFCVEAEVVCLKPKNLSYSQAASIPLAGLTVLNCMNSVNLKSGESILIHAGSGGVGSLAIQYAKSIGAKVYTTTGTDNVSWVRGLGADVVIDYKKEGYLKVIDKVDVVFDTLGENYTIDAFSILNSGGRVVSIAGRRMDAKSAEEYGLNTLLRLYMKLKLRKINILCKRHKASYRFILNKPSKERIEHLKELLESEDIKPVIDTVYSFRNVIEAFKKQQSKRAKGKLVVAIRKDNQN